MTRRVAVALLTIAGVWSLVGCSSMAIPAPCDLTIIALPADSTVAPGDPLPAAAVVLAAPSDFDRTAIEFVVMEGADSPAVNLALQGNAIARVAAHTAAHSGEFMAIAVNGTVVSVPIIQGPLLDGTIQITGGMENEDVAQRFAGCVP
jgi:preprotein translocase subunit SecD